MENLNGTKTRREINKKVKAKSYSARRAKGQMVHLLGERGHHSRGVDGQAGLDGGSRRDHCTLEGGRVQQGGCRHCNTRQTFREALTSINWCSRCSWSKDLEVVLERAHRTEGQTGNNFRGKLKEKKVLVQE